MFLFLKIEIFLKLRNRIGFPKINFSQIFFNAKKVCVEIIVGKK